MNTLGLRPPRVPSHPELLYRGRGWTSWGQFLGTASLSTAEREFVSFEEAKKWAQENKISDSRHWGRVARYGVRPAEVPSNPNVTYKDHG